MVETSNLEKLDAQNFLSVREKDGFYIDKTSFIREFWENKATGNIITRPRGFGKTWNMNMLECFFSIKYKDRGEELFGGLEIWNDAYYRSIQGTYPVISISLSAVNADNPEDAIKQIKQLIVDVYSEYRFILDTDVLNSNEQDFFKMVTPEMKDTTATYALDRLSSYLYEYYGKDVILLVDAYDTPMLKGCEHGYADEILAFTDTFFLWSCENLTGGGAHLERYLLMGVTCMDVYDLHVEIVTTTRNAYETCFGFTEEETHKICQEFGELNIEHVLKNWYGGYIFGDATAQKELVCPNSLMSFVRNSAFGTYSLGNDIDVIRPWLSNKEVVLVLKKLFDYETITIKTYDSEICSYNPRCGIFSNVYTYLLAAGYLQIVSVARESYPWKYTLRANVEATHALWDFMQGTKEASLQTKRR